MPEFRLPLDIKSLEIISQRINTQGNLVLTVASTHTKTKCHKCGKDATKRFCYSSIVQIRHTSVFNQPVILEIKPVRYQCDHCGSTTTEKYDWIAEGAK